MNMQTQLVQIKNITTTMTSGSYSEEAVQKGAEAILATGGLSVNLVVVKRTEMTTYELVNGDYELKCAQRAQEINGRNDVVNVVIIENDEQAKAMELQVETFRATTQEIETKETPTKRKAEKELPTQTRHERMIEHFEKTEKEAEDFDFEQTAKFEARREAIKANTQTISSMAEEIFGTVETEEVETEEVYEPRGVCTEAKFLSDLNLMDERVISAKLIAAKTNKTIIKNILACPYNCRTTEELIRGTKGLGEKSLKKIIANW